MASLFTHQWGDTDHCTKDAAGKRIRELVETERMFNFTAGELYLEKLGICPCYFLPIGRNQFESVAGIAHEIEEEAERVLRTYLSQSVSATLIQQIQRQSGEISEPLEDPLFSVSASPTEAMIYIRGTNKTGGQNDEYRIVFEPVDARLQAPDNAGYVLTGGLKLVSADSLVFNDLSVAALKDKIVLQTTPQCEYTGTVVYQVSHVEEVTDDTVDPIYKSIHDLPRGSEDKLVVSSKEDLQTLVGKTGLRSSTKSKISEPTRVGIGLEEYCPISILEYFEDTEYLYNPAEDDSRLTPSNAVSHFVDAAIRRNMITSVTSKTVKTNHGLESFSTSPTPVEFTDKKLVLGVYETGPHCGDLKPYKPPYDEQHPDIHVTLSNTDPIPDSLLELDFDFPLTDIASHEIIGVSAKGESLTIDPKGGTSIEYSVTDSEWVDVTEEYQN